MKKINRAVLLALVVCLGLLVLPLAGCSNGSPGGSSGADNVVFKDAAGREGEVLAESTRIFPSGHLAQIVLFSLAPDLLVGLSNRWDAAAEKYIDTAYLDLPMLGQFYGGKGELSLEEIVKADPQVIIDVGEPKSSIIEDMDGITEQVGIPAVHITATLENMGEAYRKLGTLLGKEAEAEVLASYCEDVYTNAQNIMKKVGADGKVGLIYCTGDDGLNVIARGSFHAEVIDLLGNNVAVVEDISSKGTGNPVDLEQILLWDPAAIIFSPDSVYAKVADDRAWQDLRAIKEGRYYEVPDEPYNWMGFPPSINRFMGMLWMLQLLYPDEAGCDLQEETVKFYDLFYHCTLSEQQYKDLMARSILKDR